MERPEQRGHYSNEELSAWLEGTLEGEQTHEEIRQHVASCSECARAVEELRTIAQLLSTLEAPAPSRSFRLDPATMPVRTPAGFRLLQWQETFRRTAAVAAVLLIAVFGAGLLTDSVSTPATDDVAVMESMDEDAAMESAPANDDDAEMRVEEEAADVPESAGDTEIREEVVPESDADADMDIQDDAGSGALEESDAQDDEALESMDEEQATMDSQEESALSDEDSGDDAALESTDDDEQAAMDAQEETALFEEGTGDDETLTAPADTSEDDGSFLGAVQIGLALIVLVAVTLGYAVPWLIRRQQLNDHGSISSH